MHSNPGPLISEAIALPIVPQLLPNNLVEKDTLNIA